MQIPPRLSLGLLLSLPLFAQEAEVFHAEVDWWGEVVKGGMTAVALGLLFAVGVTLSIERCLSLRRKHIAPKDLARKVLPLWRAGDPDGILALCASHPSTLARMVAYLVHHHDADPNLLIPGAQDIGARELRTQSQQTFLLAAVAALAPLLGLLGTMIGMIESFKLVEVYGDDGGASMLAGSISKALITTAVGLIIAIPTLAIYHGFKYHISRLAETLEAELEVLVNAWLLTPPRDDADA